MTNTFTVNEIVKGKVFGTFVILGFRNDLSNTETYAQLKSVNEKTGRMECGELALPLSAIIKK